LQARKDRKMKGKRWWIVLTVPAIFMAISAGRAYAAGSFEAYQEALHYGLQGLIEYFKFIIDLFEAL